MKRRFARPLTGLTALRFGTLSHKGRGEGGVPRDNGRKRRARLRRRLRQQPQPQILRHVGVLIFIHQNELEAVLVLPEYVGMFAKQPNVFQQQIAEVGGVEDF